MPRVLTLTFWISYEESSLLHGEVSMDFLCASLSFVRARSLSLFLSLRQMRLPSRNQLGLLVHGFQMFSRDELG